MLLYFNEEKYLLDICFISYLGLKVQPEINEESNVNVYVGVIDLQPVSECIYDTIYCSLLFSSFFLLF